VKNYLSKMMRVFAGGYRWWLPADRQSLLLGPGGLRLDEWISTGQAHVVKKGHHRIVYRVELPGLVFYLKHNLLPDLRSWFRQLVRPSKARMEFNRALAVAERGLPTITPLALGEACSLLGAGESYLLSESLECTQSLHCFLQNLHIMPVADSTQVRQHLARELGSLLGRIHQAGILHRDLHSGNLLVRHDPDQGFALYLIDLNAVHVGAPLNWRQSLENLAMLNRWFFFRSTRADRLRFWNAYVASRQTFVEDPGHGKDLVRAVEQCTLDSTHELCGHFERRCLKTNRYFRKIAGRHARGHVVADLDAADWKRLLADPDEPFRREGAKLYKDSNSSTVTEIDVRLGGQVHRVIYKRFRVNRWTNPLAALVRPSAALRSWVAGQALMHRSLPTPRPLMLLHRRRFGLDWEGYLMTEKIDEAQDLNEFLVSLSRLDPAAARAHLRQRIDDIARVMRELHRWQFSNRDPKAANWLIAAPMPSSLRPMEFAGVWIIDLVGISHKKTLTLKQRCKNLGRLNASFLNNRLITRADRLRFLRAYMQWALASKEGWKTWWRGVDLATQAKVARNIRLRRELS